MTKRVAVIPVFVTNHEVLIVWNNNNRFEDSRYRSSVRLRQLLSKTDRG